MFQRGKLNYRGGSISADRLAPAFWKVTSTTIINEQRGEPDQRGG